jgi:UDP-GlcNAc3NAcA epimerase
MKVFTVLGARPQFIKAAPVSRALREKGIQEFLLHTGQHYDYQMSQVFFDEMGIPKPDVNLGVGSSLHGKQTAQMLIGIEEYLIQEKPDYVLVYGDTNSTLAGALAAVKLHIPVAHIEAGLRSFNREMPEEHNRVLTDHCADLLFCPTKTAVANLEREGLSKGVYWVGDVMYDAVLQFGEIAKKKSRILDDLDLEPKKYLLATVHRQSNTDNVKNLRNIIDAFSEIDETIVFPVHPRTRKKIEEANLFKQKPEIKKIKMIEPVGYLDMLMLEQSARLILTDSGGIQKEAYFFGVPCVTLRSETEWVETVEMGWNILAGVEKQDIIKAVYKDWSAKQSDQVFGDGRAAIKICENL